MQRIYHYQGLTTPPSPRATTFSCVAQPMHLYLESNPRTLYLITDEKDELLGRPRRALVFRAGQSRSQAVVEFLPAREVNRTRLVKLTSRMVKGCLGLISVDNGPFPQPTPFGWALNFNRYLPCRCNQRYGSREHTTIGP